MASQLNLATKGLAIIVLPLVCQFIGFVFIADQLAKLEKSSLAALETTKASEYLTNLLKDLLDLRSGGDRLKMTYVFTPEFDEKRRDAIENVNKLRSMFKNEPEKLASINQAFSSAQKALDLIDDNKTLSATGEMDEFENQEVLSEIGKKLAQMVGSMDQALDLLKQQRNELKATIAEHRASADLAVQILRYAMAAETVLTMFIGFVFLKGIVSRINVMTDNTYRLAADEDLNAPVGGTDEIARLDSVFHRMAESLANAKEKEAAILDNARDIVCALDESLTFLNVNSASLAVLGYRPHELSGRKLASLVVVDELESVLAKFQKEELLPAFHARLKSRSGELVDSLWTVKWSPIEKHFFCVVHDDTQRKNAERMRTEVIQMVTHDLRTPLTTVSGYLELLERGDLGQLSERGARLLNGPIRGVGQMLGLTNDLLDMEQMESGKLRLVIEDHPVSEMFEQALETTSGVARNSGVNLVARPTDIILASDKRRIEQILVNLITNAAKFSPRDTTITLEAVDRGEAIELRVIDQGRGIPPEHLEYIFDRFRQVKESDSREKRGLGLGLAICKALVELHGGEINVASEEGKGSTFSVVIPKQR
jgi:PAS domain S-box-containing protein